MPAKAKKSAVKKGKYFEIFSWATHPLNTKPVGSSRLGACLPLHGFGILGWQLSLLGHEAEDMVPFDTFVDMPSMKKVWSAYFVFEWERAFKNF